MFLTWLPSYLVQTMHMNVLQSAGYAAIPWACATVADLVVGGWLIDRLIARGHDETRVRRSVTDSIVTSNPGATCTTRPGWSFASVAAALALTV